MVKHVADGESFFSPKSAAAHRDFGFHGSLETGPRARVKPHTRGLPKPAPAPMQDPTEPDADDMPMARGGSSGSGMLIHPMGHSVTHVTSGPSCMIQHHAHGGCTVVHDDGRVEHQMAQGGSTSRPTVGYPGDNDKMPQDDDWDDLNNPRIFMHNDPMPLYQREIHTRSSAPFSREGERQYAEGGDVSDDSTDLNLARGGNVGNARRILGARTRLPPNQRPPKNPTVTPTPTNDMAGGQMGYGVQPSDESGMMGGPGESAVPMRKGGKKR